MIVFQDAPSSICSLAMRELDSQPCKAVPVPFCCSESPHGERALAEDSVQDVTAEHHTSDDGRGSPVFTGVTGAACLGGGREGCALQWKFKISSKVEFKSEHSLETSRAAFEGRKYKGAGSAGISGSYLTILNVSLLLMGVSAGGWVCSNVLSPSPVPVPGISSVSGLERGTVSAQSPSPSKEQAKQTQNLLVFHLEPGFRAGSPEGFSQ